MGASLLTAVQDALGHETTYAYDVRGALMKVTDANGHVTAYKPDALGRPESVTGPEGETIRCDYDKAGNLARQIDPLGQATTYTYNYRGQVTAVDYSGQSRNGRSLDFTYDSQGHLTHISSGDGRRLDLTGSGTHIHTVTDYTGRTVTYTYTGGDRTAVAAPDQPTVIYGYD